MFGYLGIDIVLTLIKDYGALICVTVTTCRKAITIVLSFTLFSKPFVFEYVKSYDTGLPIERFLVMCGRG